MQKKHFAWLSNIGELLTVPPIRKIAIAILVVLLMTVFFAATPTGRAIAESVIQYFVTLFEDGRVAVNQSGNETMSYPVLYDGFTGEKQDPNEITAHIVYVDTFREFTETTGKKPFILPTRVERRSDTITTAQRARPHRSPIRRGTQAHTSTATQSPCTALRRSQARDSARCCIPTTHTES